MCAELWGHSFYAASPPFPPNHCVKDERDCCLTALLRWLRIWLASPPFFIRAACSKEAPHLQPCLQPLLQIFPLLLNLVLNRSFHSSPSSSTFFSISPSTLPSPLQPCSQSLLQLFPFLFNLVLNLSFDSSPTMAESSQTPALQAEPTPEEDPHPNAEEVGEWAVVAYKNTQQKTAKQLVKHGVPSLQSI